MGAADEPQTWDGLTRMKAKRMDAVFLLPGAEFTGYTGVVIETPVEGRAARKLAARHQQFATRHFAKSDR